MWVKKNGHPDLNQVLKGQKGALVRFRTVGVACAMALRGAAIDADGFQGSGWSN